MSLHIDVLGRLHVLWGAFGLLVGAALFILGFGTNAALDDLGIAGPAGRAAVGVFVVFAVAFVVGGLASCLVGVALGRRLPFARLSALAIAVPNLVLAPFGTALGVYTFWVLLNDEARQAFGGPLVPAHLAPVDRP